MAKRKSTPRPVTPERAMELLREIGVELELGNRLNRELSDHLRVAVRGFLDGRYSSMDHALALKPGRGHKPRSRREALVLAERIYTVRKKYLEQDRRSSLRGEGGIWNYVAGKLDKDKRTLQRVWKEWEPYVLLRERRAGANSPN
jgi:hypothetical protein